jgi:hypothetical protein
LAISSVVGGKRRKFESGIDDWEKEYDTSVKDDWGIFVAASGVEEYIS